MVPVARRGNGTPVVIAIVLAAFAIGLLRPWDLVLSPSLSGGDPPVPSRSGRPVGVTGSGPDTAGPGDPVGATPALPPGVPPERPPTCGYPSDWRTASIQDWAGAEARVWSAARAVTAAGPGDPLIPFHVLASHSVRAIGWCAPVQGDERPPLAAVGTLFRIRDGIAREVPVDRLEPDEPDALGELWLPQPEIAGRKRSWPEGRYVIRLATPSGSYVRYLGLEVGIPERDDAPPSPSVPVSPGVNVSPAAPAG